MGARRRSVLRRTGRPDRGHASHHRRGEEVDRRPAFPAGAELLHAAARPRGPAARHLHRLADAQDQGRAAGRHAVRAARPARDHGAQLDLRPARQGHGGAGPVLRPESRRAGDRDRGRAARRPARLEEQHHAGTGGRRLHRPLLLQRAVPGDHRARGADRLCRRPRQRARLRGRRRPWQIGRQAGGGLRVAAWRGDARPRPPQRALVAFHHGGVPGALAGACRASVVRPGQRQRLHPDRHLLQQDGRSSPSAAPMPCWPTSPSRRSTTITG